MTMRFNSINSIFVVVAALLLAAVVEADASFKTQSFAKRLASRFGAFFLRRYYKIFKRNHPIKGQAPYGSMNGFGFGFRLPIPGWGDYAFQECNLEEDAMSWIKNGAAKRDWVEHQGVERYWYTFVPDSAKGKEVKVPVVVDLHGMGGCATRPAMGWANVAEDNGFIVVWPQGLSRKLPFDIPALFGYHLLNPLQYCWNDGMKNTGCNKAKYDPEDDLYDEGGIDDVGFLEKVIEKVKENNSKIDPHRIYITGHSNGGVMAQRFVMETAAKNIVAGLVSIGANTFPKYENWTRFNGTETEVEFDSEAYNSIPVKIIAGRNDGMSPFEFWDKRASLSGAMNALSGWAHENQCDTDSIDVVEGDGYTRHIIQSGCDNGATVELLEVHDAGHHPVTNGRGQWKMSAGNVIPSCPFRAPAFPPSPYEHDCQLINIDTTSMAWDFISQYERPNNSS